MSIDSMINVWCLVLCDKRYDNIYRAVFKCLAKANTVDEYMRLNSGHGSRSRHGTGSVVSSKRDKSSTKSSKISRGESDGNGNMSSKIEPFPPHQSIERTVSVPVADGSAGDITKREKRLTHDEINLAIVIDDQNDIPITPDPNIE